MSWIDKELRRRQKARAKEQDGLLSVEAGLDGACTPAERIAALWERLEAANNALPAELRLARQTADEQTFTGDRAMFRTLLLAGNGAGIGYTGDAIRYFWPKGNTRKSNNFWIRHHSPKGYVLNRRLKPNMLRPSVEERPFNERSVALIIQRMVTHKQVSWRSVRKRRFWLF